MDSKKEKVLFLNKKGKFGHISTLKISQFEGYPRNRIVYVVDDDEIAFYAGVFDLPSQVDEFLSLFLKHQKYFAMFLSFLFSIEVLLGVVAYFDKERAVEQVKYT